MTIMKWLDVAAGVTGLTLVVIAFDLSIEGSIGVGLLCHWARPWVPETK